MNELLKAAKVFQSLKDIEYRFILGRKKVLTEIKLKFKEDELYHLLGLHKLVDLANISQHRISLIHDIITGTLTLEHLKRSKYYQSNSQKRMLGIEDRVQAFSYFQQMLDCNELVFRYNPNVLPYSKIEAKYLMEYAVEKPLYLFLDQNKNNDFYFCKSFFPLSVRNYSYNQIRLTLLHKEKYDHAANKRLILYSRLNAKDIPSPYEGQNR